jgi:hypothetical protein
MITHNKYVFLSTHKKASDDMDKISIIGIKMDHNDNNPSVGH